MDESSIERKEKLLESYYVRLKSTFELLSIHIVDDNKNRKIIETIESLFSKEKSFENGNMLEQKMVSIMDTEMLDFEISRKLLSSKRYFSDEHIKLYNDSVIKLNSENDTNKKRIFLLRLVQDIQWQISKRKSMEPDVEKLRKLMMISMSISILVTLLAYIQIYTTSEPTRWYYILVICAGFMGTIFSMLIGVAKHSNEMVLEDLQNVISGWHIGAKVVLGIGAALLFYYFFQSKLIVLGLFPDINQLDVFLNWRQCVISEMKTECLIGLNLSTVKLEAVPEWDANLYKLIIWSFLAGFSEKLIPDMLNKAKSQINNSV